MSKTCPKRGGFAALLCLSFFVVVGIAQSAKAQTWVASSGVVDESSLLNYEFTGGVAYIRQSTGPGTVTLRYNVLPVGDLAIPLTQPCCEGRVLWVRFQDNGSGAQVTVALKRQNVVTGEVTTLLTFDSNQFPAQSGFQAPLPTSVGSFFNFSFASGPFNGSNNQGGDSVYFLEAKLIRTARGGNPGLASISIVKSLAP